MRTPEDLRRVIDAHRNGWNDGWNAAILDCAEKAGRWAQGRNQREHERWLEFSEQIRALRRQPPATEAT